MSVLDVFNSDAFGTVQMTSAVNLLPYAPGRVGKMGIFKPEPISTTTVGLERQENTVSLITSTPRGVTNTKGVERSRNVKKFSVPHFDHGDVVLADDIQNVREFGTENRLKGVASEVNNKLAQLRQDHEVTHEFIRLGALKGSIIDGDGTTVLLNLFTEFGISQTVVDFALNSASTDVNGKCAAVLRAIQTALGAMPFTDVIGICGDGFYDALASHAVVREGFKYQNDATSKHLIETQGQGYVAPRFRFGGITWENYRGKIGDTDFVGDKACHFVVVGAPGLYRQYHAPAPYVEAVNTMGKVVYAKQERMKFDRGIEIATNSNFLALCTRPGALVKATTP